jgi:hypothetical protein
MKIFSVRLVALAATALVTGSVLALGVDLTQTPVIAGPVLAQELNYSSTAGQIGAGLTYKTKLGWGVASGVAMYIRIDVTNATFAGAITAGGITNNTTAFTNATISTGGGSGASMVLFQVTGNASGNSSADGVTVTMPALKTSDNTKPITVSYSLFDNSNANGASSTPAVGAIASATTSASLVTFSPALKVTSTPAAAASAQATVSSTYTKFVSSAASAANTGIIGNFSVGVATPNVYDNALAAITAPTALLATSTATFTGDWTAAATASSVFLGDANCGATNPLVVASLNTAKTIATVSVPASGALAGGYLCYTVKGTTEIVAVPSIVAQFAPVGATGVTVATPAAASIGAITRDGTTLQVPFLQLPGGYMVRMVLTNTGTTAASFVATTYAATGAVVGTNGVINGTIPAGGQTILENVAAGGTGNFPTMSTGARGWTVFNVGGTNQNINGVYQILAPNGASNTTNMVRPVGVYGNLLN